MAVKIGDGHKLDQYTKALWRMNDSIQTSPNPKASFIYDCTGGGRDLVGGSTESTYLDYRPFGPNGEFVGYLDGANTKPTAPGDATAVTNLIGQHTFECFINISSLSAAVNIISYDITGETSDTNYLTRWMINTAGRQDLFWESGAGVNQSMVQTTGPTVGVNRWHYVAYVKNASNILFYVNGVLAQTVARATNAAGGGSSFWALGTDNSFDQNHFLGSMRHLKMTARAKSSTEIANAHLLFLQDFALPKNDDAFVHWPMDDKADTIVDSSSSSIYLWPNETAEIHKGAAPLIYDEGASLYNQGTYLNSYAANTTTGSGVEVLRQTFQGPFTFEGWYKRNDDPTTLSGLYRGLFSFGINNSDASSNNNHLSVEITPTNTIRWFSEYATGTDSIHTFNYTLPDYYAKYHFGIRRNTTISGTHTVDLFVNGVKVSTVSGVQPYTGGSTQAMYLGYGAALSPFVGCMDDIRVSNIMRTDAEILDSYKRGYVATDLGGSYVVSGTWTNYVGTGSGIAVNVYDKSLGICVGSTTTSGTGFYHVLVPRGDTLHFAEAREDSIHLGRTDDGYPEAH